MVLGFEAHRPQPCFFGFSDGTSAEVQAVGGAVTPDYRAQTGFEVIMPEIACATQSRPPVLPPELPLIAR